MNFSGDRGFRFFSKKRKPRKRFGIGVQRFSFGIGVQRFSFGIGVQRFSFGIGVQRFGIGVQRFSFGDRSGLQKRQWHIYCLDN
ncbi:MAG: hypothetical protein KAI83_13205 [Thiomargarita sp.]|nr:hypothetical protein [Thiomargarita sp.]